MKCTLFALFFLLVTASVFASKPEQAETIAQSKNSFVFDYNLNFRTATYLNIDYASVEKRSDDIFSQYLNLNIIGKFDDKIEMSAKLASYGFSGKYNAVFQMPYISKDYSLFLQTAFLTFKSEKNFILPCTLFAGKQEFSYGDGFIVDGNNNGLLGLRGKVELFKSLSLDMFVAKVDNVDFDLYGGNLKFNYSTVFELGIYQERNNSGMLYKKGLGLENENIGHDNKMFYDLRITGGNNTYRYRAEVSQQKGELEKTIDNVITYNAYAFILEGSWKGELLSKDSNAKILFSYANAHKENSFSPTFAKRYDGLQRVGYGTLFAANNTDSFIVVPNGYYGINTIGALFDILLFEFLQTGLSLFMYSASDAPTDAGDAGFASIYSAKANLGEEVDWFMKYKYKHYFDIFFNFAIYMPPSTAGKVFANTEPSYLFQIGVNSKF
ncbi:MAG: hypothetical protein LBT18_00675 [Endomicrobium sp.]|jgi:hypothetical protein|nr:hypothetical protein [Endomicrobium sp.]